MATGLPRLQMALPWTGLISSLWLLSVTGCHQTSTNPYLQSSSTNPWASPNAAAMPPPTTQLPPAVNPGVPGQGMPYTPGPPAPGAAVPGAVPATSSSGVQGPDWDNPGSLSQQRERASVFDPFANNEVAPAIVGGRPRDFQKPTNEATRAQPYRDLRSPF